MMRNPRYIVAVILLALLQLRTDAQTTSYSNGVTVREQGLAARTHKTSSGRMVVRHQAASPHPDLRQQRDVLRYSLFMPLECDSRIVVAPSILNSRVYVERVGSYNGQNVANLIVDPFILDSTGEWRVVDSLLISVTWDVPLVRSKPLLPPSAGLLLNSEWQERTIASLKHVETPQDHVSPKNWYDRSAAYLRLETRNDGIAYVIGGDILDGASSAPFDNVALYWNGVEQPIFIDDVDSSNTLTSNDRLIFRGRRSAGDTTWFDVHDTTAIYYVTTRATPTGRKRMKSMSFAASGIDTIKSVTVYEHVEQDTGYYHPGSGIDDDHSIFESSVVYLEGFYWQSLYGRSKQAASFKTYFTPADSGSVTWMADLATTTKSIKYSPEHIISIWPPGQTEPERLDVEGYTRIAHSWSAPVEQLPSGVQHIIVQATGSEELRSTSDWYSEVLVNAFDVRGDARPLLHNGRLHFRVNAVDSSVIQVENVVNGPLYVLDTTVSTFGIVRDHRPGVTVRAGIWPRVSLNDTWDGRSYDASVTIGSTISTIDSLHMGIAVVHQGASQNIPVVSSNLTSTLAVELLKSLPESDLVVVISSEKQQSQALYDELERRGVVTTALRSSPTWIAVAASRQGYSSVRPGITAHIRTGNGVDGSVMMALEPGVHTLFVADDRGLERARVIKARNQGVSSDSVIGEIIVIAHRSYLQEASRWAAHRVAVSGKTVSLYDVDAIFEEYDAGRHTPHAIRAFLSDAFAKSKTKPTHCVLIGNASWDIRQMIKRGNVNANRVDQVPTYGRPSTDMWFGLLDDERDLAVPELIVTRFPVSTVAECKSMVDKIITADTIRYTPMLRKFLFVGGGTEQENFCQMYERMLDDSFGSEVVFTEPPLCIDTVTVCNTDYDNPGLQIRQKLNQGVAWMNYIGHGGTDVFDIKDWDAQDLNNADAYPVLATFSCLTGNYSSPSSLCENAAYLVEPRKGVVAAMGSTGYQYLPVVDLIHFRFHEAMLAKGLRTIGDLTYEAKRAFSTMNNQLGRNASLQYCILGDPFTRLRIDTMPDLRVYSTNISVVDANGESTVYVQQDSLFVNVEIWNSGVATTIATDAVVRRYLPGADVAHDSVVIMIPENVCSRYSAMVAFPTMALGNQRIEVQIDPRRYTPDPAENNVAWSGFTVLNRSMSVIDPLPYGTVDLRSPRFRVLYPYVRKDTTQEPVVLSIHRSLDHAEQNLSPLFEPGVVHDQGAYVDVTFTTSESDVATIDTQAVYWIRVLSSRSDAVFQPFVFRKERVDPEDHMIFAKGLAFPEDSLLYDATNASIGLASRNVSISVQSSGKPTADPVKIPAMRIAFGDTVVQSSFRTGINIVVIRPYSTAPRLIRRYDTSPMPSPIETGHNGGAQECLQFLRDSVSPHEIIAVAACNESFTQFVTNGLLDELKRVLRTYQSALADSLDIGSSFAFVGSKDRSIVPQEALRASGSALLAVIESSLPIRYSNAMITSVDVLRPRYFKTVETSFTDRQINSLELRGYDGTTLQDSLVNLWTAPRNNSTIERATLRLHLRASDSAPDPRFTTASIRYEPAPMLYIDSTMISILPIDALRGDSIELRSVVRNLQYRFASPEIRLSAGVRSLSDTTQQQRYERRNASIGADDSVELSARAYNNPEWNFISAQVGIDEPGTEKSLVPLFQDARVLFKPREDSSAPSISVLVHDRAFASGDYVDSLPRFAIQMRDASRLPIRSDESFVVFLNGVRIRSSNSNTYAFLSTNDCEQLYPETQIRAELRFRYPVERGENLLIVRATDASGNKDTAEIYFWHQSEDEIRGVQVAPNPTSGKATFTISMAGNSRLYSAVLNIYDVQGRLVNSQPFELYTGSTSVVWDGVSQFDSNLSPGVYYWSIMVPDRSQVHVENRTSGILTIVR